MKSLTIIGRREIISLPEFGLKNIEAKIDTGAYTTALHCSKITLGQVNNKPVLDVVILDSSYEAFKERKFSFTEFYEKEIKNSFGESEKRFFIKGVIKIGKRRIKTSISLTDRGKMRYPVLIGRKLLMNKFIVDVAKLNLHEVKKLNK